MVDKGKSRSLAEVNRILGGDSLLEGTVQDLLASRSHVDVMEIGIGYGRALLEMAWRFRNDDVSFHGVTLKPKAPLERREDLRAIAEQFNIIPPTETSCFDLPQVYFYDATRLQCTDESIDLLYSAVTIRFMDRKAEFLEEVTRVLKPGGRALMDISESNWNYPYSLATDARVLTPFTNRFVLKHGHELIPLPDYVKLFENDRFRFTFSTNGKCILGLTKLAPGQLSLQLIYNESLSMSGYDLPLRNSLGVIRGGFRTVYDIPDTIYERLVTEGILHGVPTRDSGSDGDASQAAIALSHRVTHNA